MTTTVSPERLIDERVFKKSGEFDRLRRELLTAFQRSERVGGFQARVHEIAHQRLASDPKLMQTSQEGIYRELMGELERYPVVERAVAEAPLLSEPSFAETIRAAVERILDEDRALSDIHGTR